MLNFLFGTRKSAPRAETARKRFTRLVEELNEMIDALPEKPRVVFDPETGHILPETPRQFPDEALALPRPDTADAGASDGKGDKAAGKAETVKSAIEADGGVRTGRVAPVMKGTPQPRPPKAAAPTAPKNGA